MRHQKQAYLQRHLRSIRIKSHYAPYRAAHVGEQHGTDGIARHLHCANAALEADQTASRPFTARRPP
jgi:hypothetical protein